MQSAVFYIYRGFISVYLEHVGNTCPCVRVSTARDTTQHNVGESVTTTKMIVRVSERVLKTWLNDFDAVATVSIVPSASDTRPFISPCGSTCLSSLSRLYADGEPLSSSSTRIASIVCASLHAVRRTPHCVCAASLSHSSARSVSLFLSFSLFIATLLIPLPSITLFVISFYHPMFAPIPPLSFSLLLSRAVPL